MGMGQRSRIGRSTQVYSGVWERGVGLKIQCVGGKHDYDVSLCTWVECGVTRHARLFVSPETMCLQLFPSDTLLNSKVYENIYENTYILGKEEASCMYVLSSSSCSWNRPENS